MNDFNLFIDLDGVVFDFENHYNNTVDVALVSKETKDQTAMWKAIGSVPDFFTHMPLLPGAAAFINKFAYLNPVFLTHVPVNKYPPFFEEFVQQKIRAIRKHSFPGLVIPVPGYGKKIEKATYMQRPGDVLIDDWMKNIEAWNKAGGNGILHTDFEDTTMKLEWILNYSSLPIRATN